MKEKVIYQLSTHWDREWYKPFQGFRYRLVEMIDGLIDALENDKITTFTFDGQTVVLEDYIEVRPENKDRLITLIASGRIKVGPWYVMPDELLVSGESIIENFLIGHKTAQQFHSSAWKFGYANDIFGHIAQLPQILNGFNIKGVYLGRGAGNDRRFIWKSPDESECFTYNSNYAYLKRNMESADDKNKYLSESIGKEKCEDIPVILLNYTDDHAFVNNDTIEFEKNICALDNYDITEGFENYAAEIFPYKDKLPVKYGELIETAHTTDDFRAVTHSLSSYYTLKQSNDRCERNLYEVFAPMLVMGEILGSFEKRVYFDIARKYLLKNQPHDSICGCSVDEVHSNMSYRYNQANEIADIIKEEFVAKTVRSTDAEKGGYILTVFNFDIRPMSGTITVDVDFPKDWNSVFEGNAGYARINMFDIIDEQGNKVEYQILNIEYDKEIYNKQDIINVDRYTIALESTVLPFGTTCFKIVPAEKLNNVPKTIHEGNLIAENEYLTLRISNAGDINIIDKSNGRQYKHLNTFIDESDTGNGWFYESAAINSPAIVSSGGYVEVINNGSLVNSFRITKEMLVPTKSDAINQNRSNERICMNISTIVTLKAHSKMVEFSTTIDNTPKDHRVRVMFPTGIQGDEYLASQAFCFIKRKRGVSAEGVNYREPESYEKNTSGIISVSDNENNFSFVGKEGFHEAGVYPDGTISVTMFRGFRKEFHEKNSQTAQLNKKLTFSYAVCIDDASLYSVKKRIFEKPITHMSDIKLKSVNSIISLEKGNAEISIIKPAENNDGWIIRMYNPTSKPSENMLKINIPNVKLYETNLEEIIESEIHRDNDLARIHIAPWKIKTLLIKNK